MHGTKRGMQIVHGGIRSRRARLLFYVCIYSHWYDTLTITQRIVYLLSMSSFIVE